MKIGKIRRGLLKYGVTSACLRELGKMPEEKERLMRVRECRIESKRDHSIYKGTGSSGQVGIRKKM